MSKKIRKQRPEPPYWWLLDSDNCYWCKNRNNCNGCKVLKKVDKETNKRYKG